MLSRKDRVSGLAALVAALLFTAGAHAQTPISSCMRITSPGVYALTQNLSPTGSTCITIAANGVILDLNGFGIDQTPGAPLYSSFGISDEGVPHGDLEIRNGYMRGLRSGIMLGSSRVWIHDVRFSDIAERAMQVGESSLVQACSFRGILDQIAIEAADHLEAELNILDGAGVICRSFCSLFRTSISHAAFGVVARENAFIALNALFDIGGDGIFVGGRALGTLGRSLVLQNTLTGQGQGTGITGGDHAIIETNQVSGFDTGISLESEGQITNVLVTKSVHIGILAGPDNVVENSTSSGNGGFGIEIGVGSVARNNHVSLNQSLAIHCDNLRADRAAHNSYSGNSNDDTTCLNWGNTPF